MRRETILPLVLFAALVLSVALGALAASGHFPHERRVPSLRGGFGGAVLFGACALLALSLVVGAAAAWRIMPWPAAARDSRPSEARRSWRPETLNAKCSNAISRQPAHQTAVPIGTRRQKRDRLGRCFFFTAG